MATVEISDLLFPAFNKGELAKIPAPYGIELFYEFGGMTIGMASFLRFLVQSGPCLFMVRALLST